jgi:Retinal pigment epithelial membrane protein
MAASPTPTSCGPEKCFSSLIRLRAFLADAGIRGNRQGWKLIRFDQLEAPYASMVHDFMVTRNYVLFPIMPLTGGMQRAMAGKPGYACGIAPEALARRRAEKHRFLARQKTGLLR